MVKTTKIINIDWAGLLGAAGVEIEQFAFDWVRCKVDTDFCQQIEIETLRSFEYIGCSIGQWLFQKYNARTHEEYNWF